MPTTVRVPITAAQAAKLRDLDLAVAVAQQIKTAALEAVCLGSCSPDDLARTQRVNVESDAVVVTLADPCPSDVPDSDPSFSNDVRSSGPNGY